MKQQPDNSTSGVLNKEGSLSYHGSNRYELTLPWTCQVWMVGRSEKAGDSLCQEVLQSTRKSFC